MGWGVGGREEHGPRPEGAKKELSERRKSVELCVGEERGGERDW